MLLLPIYPPSIRVRLNDLCQNSTVSHFQTYRCDSLRCSLWFERNTQNIPTTFVLPALFFFCTLSVCCGADFPSAPRLNLAVCGGKDRHTTEQKTSTDNSATLPSSGPCSTEPVYEVDQTCIYYGCFGSILRTCLSEICE